MTAAPQPNERHETDLIDRIARALPPDIRSDYYRELRHCRSLPENDEMLRILRVMQLLTLLIHDAPARMAGERLELDSRLSGCIAALDAIHERLAMLPEEVASSIAPEKVAEQVNESLRQQFAQTTIPDSGKVLANVAGQIERSVAAFVSAAGKISGQYQSTAKQALEAVTNIDSAVRSATRASEVARTELTRELIRLNWIGVCIGGLGLYLLGLATGFLWFR